MMRGGLLGTLITAAACATPSRPWMNASLPVKARVEMLLPHLSVRMHAPTPHPALRYTVHRVPWRPD
jgi:hypothetical protein